MFGDLLFGNNLFGATQKLREGELRPIISPLLDDELETVLPLLTRQRRELHRRWNRNRWRWGDRDLIDSKFCFGVLDNVEQLTPKHLNIEKFKFFNLADEIPSNFAIHAVHVITLDEILGRDILGALFAVADGLLEGEVQPFAEVLLGRLDAKNISARNRLGLLVELKLVGAIGVAGVHDEASCKNVLRSCFIMAQTTIGG